MNTGNQKKITGMTFIFFSFFFFYCVKTLETQEPKGKNVASSWRSLNHYIDLMINGGQKNEVPHKHINHNARRWGTCQFLHVGELPKSTALFRFFSFFLTEEPDLSQIPLWYQWLTVTLLLNCKVQKDHYCIASVCKRLSLKFFYILYQQWLCAIRNELPLCKA